MKKILLTSIMLMLLTASIFAITVSRPLIQELVWSEGNMAEAFANLENNPNDYYKLEVEYLPSNNKFYSDEREMSKVTMFYFSERVWAYVDQTIFSERWKVGEIVRISVSDLEGNVFRTDVEIPAGTAPIFRQDDSALILRPVTLDIETEIEAPLVTKLRNAYPNPFNPETTIAFSVAEQGSVSIDIFNIRGQKVKTLVKDDFTAGDHKVVWNGRDDSNKAVSSGVYFYRMQSGKYSATNKMIMMK